MITLVASNSLIYLYELSLGPDINELVMAYGVVPYGIWTGHAIASGTPNPVHWTLLTSMFLHGSPLHLASNMLFLWVFGDNVEDVLGHFAFILFYLCAGILAGLSQVMIDPWSRTPGIGASGAIAGVLAAYLILFPRASVRTLLLLGPFITVTRISAIVLILIWLLFQFVGGILTLESVSAQSSGVAYWAHIGGFVAGAIMLLLYRSLQDGRRR